MDPINIADAKKHLSDLVGRVAYGGESFVIARRGKPMARLVPLDDASTSPHLADAEGWLEDDDPFFAHVHGIVDARDLDDLRDAVTRARKR